MMDIQEMEDGDDMQLLSFQTKFCLALSGMLFFPLLHQLAQLLMSRYCYWLEKGTIFRISTRFVSGVQSLIIVAISTRSVFVCKNIMTDEDPFIHAYIWFGVSYFPYDIVVMYIGYTYQESCRKYHTSHARSFIRFFKKETVMVLHHVIFLVVGLPVSQVYKKRLGDFFLACFFLAEGSTPFYSMHGIFKELKIKEGLFYMINGLLFMVSFLFCRVLSTPFMFLIYARYVGISATYVPFSIPWKCTLTCFLFFALQFYWFLLICRRVKNQIVARVTKMA